MSGVCHSYSVLIWNTLWRQDPHTRCLKMMTYNSTRYTLLLISVSTIVWGGKGKFFFIFPAKGKEADILWSHSQLWITKCFIHSPPNRWKMNMLEMVLVICDHKRFDSFFLPVIKTSSRSDCQQLQKYLRRIRGSSVLAGLMEKWNHKNLLKHNLTKTSRPSDHFKQKTPHVGFQIS